MKLQSILVAMTCMVLLAAPLSAATITYVGGVEGVEVGNWRTATTAKTYDIDGDNVYGTMGAANLSGEAVGSTTPGSTTLGWAGVAMDREYYSGNSSYASIDNMDATGKTYPGIYYNYNPSSATFTFELTGTAEDYAGQTVRVGFMQDVLGNIGDYNKSLQLIQTVGGSGDSGLWYLRNMAAGDGVAEMYFFDITNVNPGDRFQIISGADVGSGTPYVSAYSFDIVPEPTTMALIGMGGLALLRRKR